MRRLTYTFATLTLAASFVVAGVQSVPAGAGSQQTLPVVSGVAKCTSPGTFTIAWSVTKGSSATVEIFGAVQSNAAEGEVTMLPSVLDADHPEAAGEAIVSGDTAGTVVLTVSVLLNGSSDREVSGWVELDGSCEAPPETMAPTTGTTAQAAATTARPSFTG